jgi:hypothetical protein
MIQQILYTVYPSLATKLNRLWDELFNMVQKESKILTFWAKSRNQLATDELMAPSTHLSLRTSI